MAKKRTTFVAAEIDRARRLLGLGKRASMAEIKIAYRHMCRQWHPDVVKDKKTGTRRMKDINAAYRLLQDYCESYRFSFSPEEIESFDPEKWWSQRFGDNVYSSSSEEGSGE
jgi:DnaJ-class molecular chaperone